MQFITLLPHDTVGQRPRVIHDEHYSGTMTLQVAGRVLVTTTPDVELLRVVVWSEVFGWAVLLFSDVGDLVALVVDKKEGDSVATAVQTAAFKGYELTSKFRTLQTPRDVAFGDRRSGRLVDTEYNADARFQISAKMVLPDDRDDFEGPFCQLRIWVDDFGWVEVVLNEVGDVVAHTVALTEKEAWKAAQVVMRRKGYVTA